MIIEHFLIWIEQAKVNDRIAAADALARTFLNVDLSFEDRCAAEASLTLLLDDPSPLVRMAMAEALSMSPNAPSQVVAALAGDQPDIASLVIARSPVLSDADLIDRVATAPGAVQRAIAGRPHVSIALSAAIAEVADASAVKALVDNPGARIADLSLARIAERLGDDPAVRGALLARRDLTADIRHLLVKRAGAALGSSPLLIALMGEKRAERVTREACRGAAIALIETAPAAEHAALVEHLRFAGDLTPGLVVRIVAHGKLDFLAAILVALTRQTPSRVAALLANGRDRALVALFGAAGLPGACTLPLLAALAAWRDVASGARVAGAQEVTFAMLQAIANADRPDLLTPAEREIVGVIKALHLDHLRRNARQHAFALAEAAAA